MSPLTRMFAARELALGGLTLAASGAARERMIQAGVAVDGVHVLAGIAAVASGAMSTRSGLMLAVVAAGSVAVGMKGLRHL
jgi:hypothetical protein